jgi:hypothetical protein
MVPENSLMYCSSTCEYGKEPSGSIKMWGTSCLAENQLLKKDSAPWSKYCSSVVNCAREDFGKPWSCATDCYLTDCVILRKCGRKKLTDIGLRVLVMNMATRNAKHPSLPACDVPILVCVMLHHLCAYDLLMDPKGSKFNTVQSEGRGGGDVRNMIKRRMKG